MNVFTTKATIITDRTPDDYSRKHVFTIELKAHSLFLLYEKMACVYYYYIEDSSIEKTTVDFSDIVEIARIIPFDTARLQSTSQAETFEKIKDDLYYKPSIINDYREKIIAMEAEKFDFELI